MEVIGCFLLVCFGGGSEGGVFALFWIFFNSLFYISSTAMKIAWAVCVFSSVQKYLHESRHNHALKRVRGIGGRFFSIKDEPEDALKEVRKKACSVDLNVSETDLVRIGQDFEDSQPEWCISSMICSRDTILV